MKIVMTTRNSMTYSNLLVLLWVHHAHAHSGGAGVVSCGSLTPSHPGSPQTDDSPFVVLTSKNSYTAGEAIDVTLEARCGEQFKGFLLQARRADPTSDTNELIGEFTAINGTQGLCTNDGDATLRGLTHNSADLKSQITVQWTAPTPVTGHVIFKSTFVKSHNTYWVAVTSGALFDPTAPSLSVQQDSITSATAAPCTTVDAPTPTVATSGGLSRDSDCGTSRGCFDDCNTGCTFTVSWATEGNNIRFRLKTLSTGNSWMAVGFSSDNRMGDDSISECVVFGGVVRAFQSYNVGHSNSRLTNPEEGISDVSGSVTDGVFSCSFLRVTGGTTDSQSFNLTLNWFLLAAQGPANSDFSKSIHSVVPTSTASVINLQAELSSSGTTTTPKSPLGLLRDSECGTSRGCFDDCNTGCTFTVSWVTEGNNIRFRLKTLSTGNSWMAVGFSSDNKMGDDSIGECIVFGGVVRAFQSYNVGHSNSRLTNPEEGISDVSGSVTDGVFSCSFLRVTGGTTDSQSFNLTLNWFLLAAQGPANSDFSKSKHSVVPTSTASVINLEAELSSSGTTTTPTSPLGLLRDSECGTSRGCFDDCNTGCTFTVSWATKGNNIRFWLKTLSTGNSWMAVGFSSDNRMGDDSVSECVMFGGVVRAFQSYNLGHSNSRLTNPEEGISDVSGSVTNGVFSCSFLRVTDGTTDRQSFNLTLNWFLLAAQGLSNSDFSTSKHSVVPTSTASVINLQAEFSSGGTTTPKSSLGLSRDSECGTSRGCFDDCNTGCTFTVSWATEGDNIRFWLKTLSSGNSWMAVGFSSDNKMGDDSVSECVVFGGVVRAFQSYNVGYSNSRLTNPEEGISDVSGSVTNGVFSCSFLRVTDGTTDRQSFSLTLNWFLLAAQGLSNSDFSTSKHSVVPTSTASVINLQAEFSSGGTTTPKSSLGLSRDSECGTSRGCFDDCSMGCTFTVSWATEGNNIRFWLKTLSSGNSWMAVGFSSDNKMGDDSVSECVVFGGVVRAFQSYNSNSRYSNSRLTNPEEGISDVSGSVTNGVFSCSFLRVTDGTTDRQSFNLTLNWFLLAAKGPSNSDFSTSKHSVTPTSTASVINLQADFSTSGATTLDFLLVKAHVICWLWLMFVPLLQM